MIDLVRLSLGQTGKELITSFFYNKARLGWEGPILAECKPLLYFINMGE